MGLGGRAGRGESSRLALGEEGRCKNSELPSKDPKRVRTWGRGVIQRDYWTKEPLTEVGIFLDG